VVSVAGKVAPLSAAGMSQEGERKRTTDDVSKDEDGVETGDALESRDESGGSLLTAQMASGVEVARAWFRLLHGTWEPVDPDRAIRPVALFWPAVGRAREIPKQRELRGAEYRCGAQGRTVS
jgi:hypothetical protein